MRMVSGELTQRWKRVRRLKEGFWEGQIISSGICWKEFDFVLEPLKIPKQQTTFPSFYNFFSEQIHLLMESEINVQCKSSLAEHEPFGGFSCGVGALGLNTNMSPG